MADFGLKVLKEGADISSTDVRDLLMSSKYSMLKYHSDSTASLTLVPGDTDKYVEVSHGLGYVPAFIAYFKYQGVQYFIPSLPRSGGFSEYAYAWSSSSVVRCGYAFSTGSYNRVSATPPADWWDDHYGVNTFVLMGNTVGSGFSGALRFTNVTVPKDASISSAVLEIGAEYVGSGTGNIQANVWGIDEDNTGDFGSSPMGRTKTTASTYKVAQMVQAGEYFGIDVKSQVEEITTRASWVSGNAMGFIYNDAGSASDVFVEDDDYSGIESKLTITYGSNATVEFRVIIFKDKIA